MIDAVLQNKRNPNKFIEVRRYDCGHYVWRQYIENPETHIRNYTGCSLRRVSSGMWHRVSRQTLKDVLPDYACIFNQWLFN